MGPWNTFDEPLQKVGGDAGARVTRAGVGKIGEVAAQGVAILVVHGHSPREVERTCARGEQRFRERIALVEVELKALEMTQLRVVAAERDRKDKRPDPASSILKIKGSEIQQAVTELALELVGPYAMPAPEEPDEGSNEPPIGPDWAETVAPVYFNWRKISIYGGSNEIQKNIIAKAILGL